MESFTPAARLLVLSSIPDQVYPGGAQHELTSTYHWVALRNFAEFAELLDHANRPMSETYQTAPARPRRCSLGPVTS